MNISIKLSKLLAGIFLLFAAGNLQAQCATGETFFSFCYGNGEVNTVAFEVCPSAGMAAEATILQGAFGTFDSFDNLTVYQGTSGSGTSGVILFGPANGDQAGQVISGNIADECLIFVINSDMFINSCQDMTFPEVELQVCGRSIAPTVAFTAPADLCINVSVQTGLSGGLPTGGVYSGPGVTDDGNGMTYSFDPVAAGAGVQTLTYTLGGGSAMDDVEVFAIPATTFTALADLCIDAGIQTGLGGGMPTGGVYSGPGVTDDGNGMTYSFNPAIAGLGVHTITYTEPSICGATAIDDVEVLAACGCPAGLTNFFYCFGNIEINTVAFEVCPTAGMAASATIVAGEFGIDDNLTVFSGASGSGTSGVQVFGPSTGNLMNSVISSGVADDCLIFVVNTGGFGSCQDGFVSTGLTVCGESVAPSVNLVVLMDWCIDDGLQTGLSGGTPTGGVYSGSGVSDDGNGMTYTFDPAAAGVGSSIITYTLVGDSDTDLVEVFNTPTVNFTAPADLCENVASMVFSNLGTPSGTGGMYAGPGVTDIGDGVNFIFNPATAGVGVHTITYNYTDGNGCMGSASDDIEVFAIVTATFTALADLCVDAGVQAGLGGGTPTGGTYSGPGVSDDGNGMTYSFDPAAAGVGTHTITYSITNGACPTSTAMDDVEVFALPTVTFTAPADLCIDAGVQSGLGGGMPTGGVYSGPGVIDDGNGMTYSFDPAAAGVGIQTITYTFANAGACTDAAMDDIAVFSLPTITFTALADLCIDAGVQNGLGGGLPTGGTYSGSGVTDDGNGMTYSFDPAAAGAGIQTLTYTFTDGNGCSASAMDDVEVFALPNVTFTALADLCIDAGVQTGLGGGMPTGGLYSGPGVANDTASMTYSFNPVAAGVGTHTITYTFTDGNGCSASAMDDVEVFDLPVVSLSTAQFYCLDAPIQNIPIVGGSPSGGVYSGPGVTDNGNGTNYFLDPTVNGPGTITITYTFTDANGCTDIATSNIDIFDCDFDMTDPCFCLNNASTIDVDAGTGGDDGQFAEMISVIDANGMALPSNQIWTVTTATGAFDANNVPAVGMQSTGVPIATDGSVTLTFNAVLGTYELPFVHVDAIGYSITVEGPFGQGSPVNQSLTIGNTCQYPNPEFNPMLPDQICAADMPITLGGTDTNGNGADAITFFINGTPATVFDPSALTPGNNTVVMVFNGADDGNGGMGTAMNPASPGCIQNVQDVVEVLAGAPPTISCPADNFGLPLGCNVTVPAAATTFNITGGPSPDPALPTVTDGCGTATLSSSDVTTDNDCIRTVTRTYTVTDQLGNTATCNQVFTFTVDMTPPTFDQTLPVDVTVECDAIPTAEVLTASDNCVMLEPVIFINEIHYDNTGGDVNEFIEVAGTA
ncbi:MAG: hypothetical protein AAFP19_04000, partial [Bacteroidota bacterium]